MSGFFHSSCPNTSMIPSPVQGSTKILRWMGAVSSVHPAMVQKLFHLIDIISYTSIMLMERNLAWIPKILQMGPGALKHVHNFSSSQPFFTGGLPNGWREWILYCIFNSTVDQFFEIVFGGNVCMTHNSCGLVLVEHKNYNGCWNFSFWFQWKTMKNNEI